MLTAKHIDGSRWVFLTRASLPADPVARGLERRGRWWLVLSYVLCPCHLPVTLSLAALVFGGSAVGATVAANAGGVAAVLTLAYVVVLWRGFRQLRRAKARLAAGEALRCSADGCAIVPAGAP